MVGPPHFIGLGAQGPGTAWWWSLLRAHPDMVGSVQETRVLGDFGWRPLFSNDVAAYHRYFPRPEGSVTGEWSSDYLGAPGIVDHIRACAPGTRLLAMLPDPLERYRNGIERWRRAKERRGKRLNLPAARRDALRRSFYGFALRPYVQSFGRDHVLVLQLERCLLDPLGEYRRTLAFLGLRAWLPSKAALDEQRPDGRPAANEGDAEPDDLVARMEPDVRMLRTLVSDLDLSVWPNFRHLAAETP
jgi:hypothetical protein